MPEHDNTTTEYETIIDDPRVTIHRSTNAITVEGGGFAVMVSISHGNRDHQLEFERIY